MISANKAQTNYRRMKILDYLEPNNFEDKDKKELISNLRRQFEQNIKDEDDYEKSLTHEQLIEQYNKEIKEKNNKAFTSFDSRYISLVEEEKANKIQLSQNKKILSFAELHEVGHILLGRKGGIIPNLIGINLINEGLINYFTLLVFFAPQYIEYFDHSSYSMRAFYPFYTKIISDCYSFLNYDDHFVWRILYEEHPVNIDNIQLNQLTMFLIEPKGVEYLKEALANKIKGFIGDYKFLTKVKTSEIYYQLSHLLKGDKMTGSVRDFFTLYNKEYFPIFDNSLEKRTDAQ